MVLTTTVVGAAASTTLPVELLNKLRETPNWSSGRRQVGGRSYVRPDIDMTGTVCGNRIPNIGRVVRGRKKMPTARYLPAIRVVGPKSKWVICSRIQLTGPSTIDAGAILGRKSSGQRCRTRYASGEDGHRRSPWR